MIKTYHIVYLNAKSKTSKKGNPYIEYNLVLEVPMENGKFRRVSLFTISAKDIVDFANKEIELDPQFITTTTGTDKEGKEVVYYNYDLSSAKEKTEVKDTVNEWAK